MTSNPTENNIINYSLKACDFLICGFFERVLFIAFNTESESENIIILLLVSQVLKKLN